jgi:uncharacterized C2H2 Zn-finger protein
MKYSIRSTSVVFYCFAMIGRIHVDSFQASGALLGQTHRGGSTSRMTPTRRSSDDGALLASPPPTAAAAATTSSSSLETNNDEITERRGRHHHKCEICNTAFESRNAMFRHIRTAHASKQGGTPEEMMARHSVSLHFGYLGGDCEGAGEIVRKAFEDSFVPSAENDNDNDNDNDDNAVLEISSTSQTSIAKARSLCLGQDGDCPAAEDILFVNFRTREDSWNQSIAASMIVEISRRASEMRNDVTVHGMRDLQQQQQQQKILHAEHACTQEIFHFLLPLHWLPDADEILKWYHGSNQVGGSYNNTTTTTPQSLRQFKELLRSVESPPSKRMTANSRFGALKHKTKRPWHCYSDPKLQGEASPNSEVVWRIVDRARWIGFVKDNDDDDDENAIFLVTEFCGDAFLKQQIRRTMATLVAMAHHWLPDNFLERTIHPNVLVETPLAPSQYMYRATSRFHAYEIYHEGRRFWELDDVHRINNNDAAAAAAAAAIIAPDPIAWIQQRLIHDVIRQQKKESDAWLAELRDVVSPRICAQLEDLTSVKERTTTTTTDDENNNNNLPEVYERVLYLLREVVRTKQWPSTSNARSNVIGNLDGGGDGHSKAKHDDHFKAGSFTVVSEKEFEMQNMDLPMGNSLFPELATAVFDLEYSLSSAPPIGCNDDDDDDDDDTRDGHGSSRPPSSHCAINCNAQFTPHVDSGRGAGQSLSMIVGLGDYSGGELMLEGTPHDIRYETLEFDGWKLRHWTRPFAGERFSLVWFTPEGMVKQTAR